VNDARVLNKDAKELVTIEMKDRPKRCGDPDVAGYKSGVDCGVAVDEVSQGKAHAMQLAVFESLSPLPRI